MSPRSGIQLELYEQCHSPSFLFRLSHVVCLYGSGQMLSHYAPLHAKRTIQWLYSTLDGIWVKWSIYLTSCDPDSSGDHDIVWRCSESICCNRSWYLSLHVYVCRRFETDGPYSWVVAVCALILWLLGSSPITAFGVFYVEFLEVYHGGEVVTSWILACHMLTLCIMGNWFQSLLKVDVS